MADQVCRLCFLGVDFNGGEPFSPIRKYEELLENILGPNVSKSQSLAQITPVTYLKTYQR